MSSSGLIQLVWIFMLRFAKYVSRDKLVVGTFDRLGRLLFTVRTGTTCSYTDSLSKSTTHATWCVKLSPIQYESQPWTIQCMIQVHASLAFRSFYQGYLQHHRIQNLQSVVRHILNSEGLLSSQAIVGCTCYGVSNHVISSTFSSPPIQYYKQPCHDTRPTLARSKHKQKSYCFSDVRSTGVHQDPGINMISHFLQQFC